MVEECSLSAHHQYLLWPSSILFGAGVATLIFANFYNRKGKKAPPSSSSSSSSPSPPHEESWRGILFKVGEVLMVLGAGLFGYMESEGDDEKNRTFWQKATLTLFLAIFFDYFLKPSPLLEDAEVVVHPHDRRRSWWDKLVWTSYIYGLASALSFYLGQYSLGTIQFITCIGSTYYHLYKEALFFNLDNMFATSLLFTTVYSVCLAAWIGDGIYFNTVMMGLPIAVFLISYCGMPARLVLCASTGRGQRCCAGDKYDFWHALWHLVSGFGTALNAFFFYRHWPELQCGGGNFPYFSALPLVPTMSLLLAFAVNMAGNVAGVMPVL